MSRQKELLKSTLILSLGTFLPKLTTIITLPILSGYLTKAEYGVFDLINTLVSLVIPLVTLKLEMATFRFLIDCRGEQDKSSMVISNSLCAVLPISLIASIILSVILRIKDYSVIICTLIGIYFSLDNIYAMFQQTARGLGHNLWYSISSIINAVVNMVLIVALVWGLNIGLLGLMIALDVALLVSVVFTAFAIKLCNYFRASLFSWCYLKELFKYSWPLVPNSLSSWVLNLSDRLIITAVLGIEANAVYGIANKIPSLFNTFQGTFISAWHENASISVNDKDSDEYYSKMFDAVFTIMIGIMAGLIAITPILFKILINQKYMDAYYQMPFLFGGMMCFSLSSFMGGIYAAHKITKSVGLTTIVAAITNLAINFLLIRFIGLYAASISTFVSYFLLTIFRMIDVKRFQPINYNIKKISIYSLIILCMCAVNYSNSFYLNICNFIFGIVFAVVINKTFAKGIFKIVISRFERKEK